VSESLWLKVNVCAILKLENKKMNLNIRDGGKLDDTPPVDTDPSKPLLNHKFNQPAFSNLDATQIASAPAKSEQQPAPGLETYTQR